jgi:hypothetical protein
MRDLLVFVRTYQAYPLSENVSSSTIVPIVSFIAVIIYLLSLLWSEVFGYKVPVFGIKSLWEPIVVSNFRFFRHAEDVLVEGYRAVSRKCLSTEIK